MNEKLKFCPFCGGEAEIRKFDEPVAFRVVCKVCLVKTWFFETKQEAINAWNTRVKE